MPENDGQGQDNKQHNTGAKNSQIAFDKVNHVGGNHTGSTEEQLCAILKGRHFFTHLIHPLVLNGSALGAVVEEFFAHPFQFDFFLWCQPFGIPLQPQGVPFANQVEVFPVQLHGGQQRRSLTIRAEDQVAIDGTFEKLLAGHISVGVFVQERARLILELRYLDLGAVEQGDVEHGGNIGDALDLLQFIANFRQCCQRCIVKKIPFFGGVGDNQKVTATVVLQCFSVVIQVCVVFQG